MHGEWPKSRSSNGCETARVERIGLPTLDRRLGMVRDLLIAAIIVVIAVALGVAVHPLLLLLLILAAFWLFGRRSTW